MNPSAKMKPKVHSIVWDRLGLPVTGGGSPLKPEVCQHKFNVTGIGNSTKFLENAVFQI